jgi:nickel-dependent lactate racemase
VPLLSTRFSIPNMKIKLAYGEGRLEVEFPQDRSVVIEPTPIRVLPDERAALMAALDQPIGAPPLRQLVSKSSRVTIVFTDITRATPNHRLIPWLLDYLSGLIPRENITLLNGLGTHRPNTRAELEKLLTPGVVENYRVLNHEPENLAAHVQLGVTRDGTPALLNRHLVEADVRIITGFIEPHFFAGFSGGPKGIMPGVAHLQTVMSNHRARNISDANAVFGVTAGNPIWEEMRDLAWRAGPSFLLNVALDDERRITGIFAGDLMAAHQVGIEFVRRSAMQPVGELFDVVVTTNSGYPLDLNLYQGVKGMSAGARILKPGGTLILAAECREGVPANSPMDKMLRSVAGPEEVLALLAASGEVRPEQWQAQILALIQRRASILVYSSLPDEIIRAAHLQPCRDISAAVAEALKRLGNQARVAVLPQGPLTIPYLKQNAS